MEPNTYCFYIPEIPDHTHYKYVTSYEGSVKKHIFLRAEHLLRMVANYNPGEITLVLRFFYDPKSAANPQDRMRLTLNLKTAGQISPALIDQIVLHGPMSEFYNFEESDSHFKDWELFHSTTEIIRLEEGLKPSSPPGLDIHKLNDLIPDIYYCIHPFKPRKDNDFLMFDKACSFLNEPALMEIIVQPTSQLNEMELLYREIVKLIAVNSYSRDEYIIDSTQLDPLKALYEPKTPGARDMRAKDPIADEFLRTHREFHRILRQPQLQFNIKVWAHTQETAHLLASTAAECSFEEGTYRLLDYDKHGEWFERSMAASDNLLTFSESCYQNIWASYNVKGLFRLAHMASVDELKGIFRLPVAGYSTPCCLWKSTDYHRKTETQSSLLIGHTLNTDSELKSKKIRPGPLSRYLDISSHVEVPVTMPTNLLTKHMFVSGVPGSGKTTAIFNLMIQLYMTGVPFLIIEPGKAEYRQIKMLQNHPDPTVQELAKKLRIYTPGKEEVSPFRFNPFQHPKDISTDEHIGQLLTCFEASMPLGGPLQALLAESIEFVYRKKERGVIREKQDVNFPCMSDLVDAASQIMKKKGYAGEVRSNLSAAIDVRLSSLTRLSMGKIFRCTQSLPSVKELLKHPTIIEIQNLNSYQACLLILFLLSAIWEEIRIARRYSKNLKHVTVIEEAHNIVGRTDQARPSEDFADPKAYAAEYIIRMLAEIRALGEGIIIADQLPSAVASSVVKNTGTKLAHRLVSLVDREDLGGAMLLQGPQMEEIARLEPGQAYYFTEGLYAPRQISGLDAHGFLGLGEMEPPDNHELSSIIKNENWFLGLQKDRHAYMVQLLSKHYKMFEQSMKKASSDLEDYQKDFQHLRKLSKKQDVNRNLSTLRLDLIKTKNDLNDSYLLFHDFVRLIPPNIMDIIKDEYLIKYKHLYSLYRQLLPLVLKLDDSLSNLEEEVRTLIEKGAYYDIKGD